MLKMRNEKHTNGLEDLISSIDPKKRGILVEVGSWLGESSLIFSKYFKQVVCIDPWDDELAIKIGCLPFLNENENMDLVFNTFLKNIWTSNNISYIRKTSLEACCFFPEKSIDVIYLDGDHSYPAMIADIEGWSLKLKDNGVFCGHDYSKKDWPGVVSAVNEKFKSIRIFPDNSWMTLGWQ